MPLVLSRQIVCSLRNDLRFQAIIIIYSLRVFQTSFNWWFFTEVWVTTSLPKPPGLFSWTLLDNIVVWMISTRAPTSNSSSPFNNPLVTVPKAPITISIIVTFMFHNFFSLSFSFFYGQPGQESPQFCKFSFFVVDYHKVWSSDRD